MKSKLSPPLQQVDRTYVRYGKGKLSYFGGCDYFRLATHPAILEAVQLGMKRHGLNVAASRMTTGNHELYDRLERELTTFFRAESATLVSNGYLANMVAAEAIAGEFSHALIDAGAHSALHHAAQLLRCPINVFQHCDSGDLAGALRDCGKFARPILLTDGMFAQDGAIAPLKTYLELLPAKGAVLLDDAHSAGVLGKSGKGSLEYEGVDRERIIQTITLSKAFGVYGGAILGSGPLRKKILARSELFAGNTPLPLPLANGALCALTIIRREPELRMRLQKNTTYFKTALMQAGVSVVETPSPIVSFIPQTVQQRRRTLRKLFAGRIYPSLIQYGKTFDQSYFRFALSSEHTTEQLDHLLRALVAEFQSLF